MPALREPVPTTVNDRGAIFARCEAPESRPYLRVTSEMTTKGRRVIVQTPADWYFDRRAVSDPYLVADGDRTTLMVDVVTDEVWWAHKFIDYPLRITTLPAQVVFIERPTAAEAAAAT